MSLIAMQSVIARLCVDEKFRRGFAHEPGTALGQYDLTPEESENIRQLDMGAVGEYAASLVGKKAGTTRRWLPLSISHLEATLSPERTEHLLRHFSVENIRDTDELGGEWVRGEFERLCAYLRGRVAAGEVTSPHFSDLLDFEELSFRMTLDPETSQSAADFVAAKGEVEVDLTDEFAETYRPVLGRHVSVHRFNYDVAELVTALDEGGPLPELEEGTYWILFFKIPHSVKVEAHTINPPLRDLLELCRGDLSVREIIAEIASRHASEVDSSGEELKDDCLQILGQLYEYAAIRFVREAPAH